MGDSRRTRMRQRYSRTTRTARVPEASAASGGEQPAAGSEIAAGRLLDSKGAAARLGLSVRTLQKWRMRGCGPRFVKLGHAVRYEETEIEAFIRARERGSTSAS